jgi:hypothetical protein
MFNLDFLFLNPVELPLYEHVNVTPIPFSFPIADHFHGGYGLWFFWFTRSG